LGILVDSTIFILNIKITESIKYLKSIIKKIKLIKTIIVGFIIVTIIIIIELYIGKTELERTLFILVVDFKFTRPGFIIIFLSEEINL